MYRQGGGEGYSITSLRLRLGEPGRPPWPPWPWFWMATLVMVMRSHTIGTRQETHQPPW